MELDREGIWVIRKIKDGCHFRFEGEKLEDLPEIMLRASFEPYRGVIYKALYKCEDDEGFVTLTAKEIMEIIFNSLKKK